MNKRKIYVVGGPTASGKSAHALDLAAKHDGIVINADSMQIYEGLPTLTAQPPEEDKNTCPHKLYGVLHPNEACSAGNWREMIEPLIVDILNQDKAPIVVGGSGLYINALLYGLSPIPDIPSEIRAATNQAYEDLGKEAFFKELQKRDPIMAERFHEDHSARIIRAWEVLEATGKSLSEWQEMPLLAPPTDWQFEVNLVMPERDTLYDRCNQRFIWMLENGAIEELEAFIKAKEVGEISQTALLNNALGVKPLTAYLKGEMPKETAIERGQGETRRYAKRQVTWFRHQVKENQQINFIS